jgi:transcriptional regulator
MNTQQTKGRQHGYGVARRIEQMARGVLTLNQGTIYPALLRLEQQGLITSSWGISDNNRRAKFYEITRAGEKHLAAESKHWTRMVTLITGLLES